MVVTTPTEHIHRVRLPLYISSASSTPHSDIRLVVVTVSVILLLRNMCFVFPLVISVTLPHTHVWIGQTTPIQECTWTKAEVKWIPLQTGNAAIRYSTTHGTVSLDEEVHSTKWANELKAGLSFGIKDIGNAGAENTFSVEVINTVRRELQLSLSNTCEITCPKTKEGVQYITAWQWTLTTTNLRTNHEAVIMPCIYLCTYGGLGKEANTAPKCLSIKRCDQEENCQHCVPVSTSPVKRCRMPNSTVVDGDSSNQGSAGFTAAGVAELVIGIVCIVFGIILVIIFCLSCKGADLGCFQDGCGMIWLTVLVLMFIVGIVLISVSSTVEFQ